MKILGISFSKNKTDDKVYTLYVTEPFDSYYKNEDGSRDCEGLKAYNIYAGTYDCDGLKPGMEIDISYDKAISTKNGVFQPIKKIEVLSNETAPRPAVRPAVKPQQEQQ